MKSVARILLLVLVVVVPGMGTAQNLVPNGSFEDYTTCPQYTGYVQYCTGWQSLYTSPDYFHACNGGTVVGVPFSQMGYQEAADGEAYVGMATTVSGLSGYREIIGIELSAPLQAGVPVCLSFKMAVGGFGSWPVNSALYTSRGVGMRFFNAFPADWQAYLYPSSAALYTTAVATDTAIWYSIGGQYVPDSDYTHLAIGNFFPDSASAITVLDSTGFGNLVASYAFIDDVRTSFDLTFCTLNLGSNEREMSGIIRAHPTPFVDQFTVTLGRSSSGPLRWKLLGACGRQVLSGRAPLGSLSFLVPTGPLPQGSYVFCAYDDEGAYAPIRLVSVSP